MMYYGNIKKFSIENGPGVRVSLFVSGCRNHCKNCFSPHTWAFDYGLPFTAETEEELLQSLMPDYITGLTVLGGEPFEPENQPELLPVLKKIRAAVPEKSIWVYTGFTFEELHDPDSRGCTPVVDQLLAQIDVLVDGRFEEENKDLRIRFRGSTNQRIIDVPATLESGVITLKKEYMNRRRLNPTT